MSKTRRAHEPWDTAKAEKMWLDGSTGGEIAEALGISRSSVIGHMNRKGLRKLGARIDHDAADAIVRQAIAEARSAEWAAAEITAKFGRRYTVSAVRSRADRMGLAIASERATARATAPSGPSATKSRISWGQGTCSTPQAPDKATVKAIDAAPLDPAELKTLAERGAFDCAFPIGAADPMRGQLYCGRPTEKRDGYCPACATRMRGATVRPLDRLRDTRVVRATGRAANEGDTDLMGMIA